MTLFKSDIFNNDTPNLATIINNANAGVWEFNVATKGVKWSSGFYRALGYEPGEIECSYSNFIDNILYFQDRKKFIDSIDYVINRSDDVAVRLLTKHGYQWFQSSTQKQTDSTVTGTIINIHRYKLSELELTENQEKLEEANKLARFGNWELDIATQNVWLCKEIYEILELEHTIINMEELISFFEPDYRSLISEAIKASCINGQSYDLDLQLRTAKDQLIWVKVKGVTIIDDYGKCVILKGIIQDISQSKKKEAELKSSLDSVKNHNTRLQNFAHIVSHNLRSHTGNLEFLVNLHEKTALAEDKQEIFSHIKSISQSLNTTIEHLNKIVKIESEVGQEKQLIKFQLIYQNVIKALDSNIKSANAVVTYDFDNCIEMYYIPAYLESIFHNLLSNSLKYRHPDRQPVIKCQTMIKEGSIYLTFEDNGLGIDIAQYGHMLFGMYQTFHKHNDARGVGLFITRNQIEALGGEINVESAVNIGTKFIIRFT